MTMKLLSFMIC